MGRIGFTTTIPVEMILAAGKVPVDLNNLFINADRPQELVDQAEEEGYPRNICGWIKGIYSVALQLPDMEALVAVMQGDCSNTQALVETLVMQGIKTIPFAYPFDRDPDMLRLQMEKLRQELNVTWEQVETVRRDLAETRELLRELDELTWKHNLVSGFENHYYQVSATDFNQDPEAFTRELERFVDEVKSRAPFRQEIRLAYIGVPPIVKDLYQYLESQGARVVYNEIQRQFAMPFNATDLVEQYLLYTYPYGAFARLDDILVEIEKRNVDGVIHYVQTFCFRQIEDIIFRSRIKKPFLTLEGDKPGYLDAHTRMRVEAFLRMLASVKGNK